MMPMIMMENDNTAQLHKSSPLGQINKKSEKTYKLYLKAHI